MPINFVLCNASLELFFGNKRNSQTKLTLLQEHIHNPRTSNDSDFLNENEEEDSTPLNNKRSYNRKRNWSEVRPDILHFCLLSLHDSILNKEGLIQVYFETLDGRLYRVSNKFRVPRTFKVFNKVFSNFLHSNSPSLKTETGEVLVELLNCKIDDLVPIDVKKIALCNNCDKIDLKTFLNKFSPDFDGLWFFLSASPCRSLEGTSPSDTVDVASLHKQILSRDFKRSSRDPNHLESIEKSCLEFNNSPKKLKFDFSVSIREFNLSCLANCYTLLCTLENLLNY